jgi:hypothetical protein
MKRNILMGSIVCLTIVVTLAFQNCNSKQFAADTSNGVSGSMASMDTNGTVDGVVDIITCKAGEEDANCPSSVTIKFFAVVNNAEVAIGQSPAQEISPGSYAFSFSVPAQYKCKPIVAYVVHPENNSLVKLPADATFDLWGNDSSCTTVTPGNGGGGTGGGPSASSVPKVKVDGFSADGRLVEVYGKCTDGADINFSGDVSADLSKDASCSGGAFKFCTLLPKNYMHNYVTGKQSMNSQIAQDTADINLQSPPVVPLTYETMVKSGAKGLAVTGRCFTGGKVKLNIYNADIATIDCVNGMFSYSGSPLVATSERILHATLTTPFAVTQKIAFSVDGEGSTPSCSIASTTPHANFCTQQAGTVKGSCMKDMPVVLYVNGKEQNFGVCSAAGTYEISNVALEKVGMVNEIKVVQKTPYGKSCTAMKSLMSF